MRHHDGARLVAAVCLIAVACAASRAAEAGFAYAFSENFVSEIKITHGLQSFRGPLEYENSAYFEGAGDPDVTDNGTQAKAGDGPFPGENSFTLPVGNDHQYARADAGKYLDIFDANVAEVSRYVPGTAAARALTSFTMTVGVTDVVPAITISFTADPFMHVEVSSAQNHARALISFVVGLLGEDGDDEGDEPDVFLEWRPEGTANAADSVKVPNGGTLQGRTEPFSLNHFIQVPDPLEEFYNPVEPGAFSLTYKPPAGHDQFQLVFAWLEYAEVRVPEPWAAPMLGVLGILLASRRRRR